MNQKIYYIIHQIEDPDITETVENELMESIKDGLTII